MKTKLPTYDQLMNPLLRALTALGGSGSIEEIYNKVVELEQFSDEVLASCMIRKKSHETGMCPISSIVGKASESSPKFLLQLQQ
jgi:hypothetical protein